MRSLRTTLLLLLPLAFLGLERGHAATMRAATEKKMRGEAECKSKFEEELKEYGETPPLPGNSSEGHEGLSMPAKCYIECIMENEGLLKDGRVSPGNMAALLRTASKAVNSRPGRFRLDASKWSQAARKCETEAPRERCEHGSYLWFCIMLRMSSNSYLTADDNSNNE